MALKHSVHHLLAFGLRLRSDLPCPELPEAVGEPEVEVRLGEVPPCLGAPWRPGQLLEALGERLLLGIPEVGRYLVEGGRRITVAPEPGVPPERLRLFLLGSAFGALLHQLGCLPLHGSALAGPYGAFVLAGPSGAGKSTLAAALRGRGLRVLSDDVCAVSVEPRGPLLWPAYPRLHLREEALAHVPPGPRAEGSRAWDKAALDVSAEFSAEPAPLVAVFLVEPAEELDLAPLAGLAALRALAAQTYRPAFVHALGREGEHFRLAALLADHVRVLRLRRPPGLARLAEVADRILACLEPAHA